MCTRTRFKLVFLEVLFSYMFGQYSPILPQLLNDSHVESRIFSSSSNTATKVDLSRRIPAHIFFNCFSRQFPGFPDCQNNFQQASHGRSRAPQKSWKRVCFHRSCLVNVRSRSKRYEFGLPRRSTNLVCRSWGKKEMAARQIPATFRKLVVSKLSTNFREAVEIVSCAGLKPSSKELLIRNRYVRHTCTDVASLPRALSPCLGCFF